MALVAVARVALQEAPVVDKEGPEALLAAAMQVEAVEARRVNSCLPVAALLAAAGEVSLTAARSAVWQLATKEVRVLMLWLVVTKTYCAQRWPGAGVLRGDL